MRRKNSATMPAQNGGADEIIEQESFEAIFAAAFAYQ